MSLTSHAVTCVMRLLAVLTLSASFASGAQAAVVRVVDGAGILTGAKGVSVNGALYDVEFRDGTCISLFSGCDSESDFVFKTQSAAFAAARALQDLVFLDSSDGYFDISPAKTNGCTLNRECRVVTPYGRGLDFVDTVDFVNGELDLFDFPDKNFVSDFYDTGYSSRNVYAVWASAAPVPEPSALVLLGVAGVALGWSQRRHRLRASDRAQ